MKINIIKIGNSLEIRIPKKILEDCGFKESVIVQIKNGKLVISPSNNPREGWDKAFKKMAKLNDDNLNR